MNTLPEEIQDTIYKYKHQMEFSKVVREFKIFQMRDDTFYLSQDIFKLWMEGETEHEEIQRHETTLLTLKQNLSRLGALGWDEYDSNIKRIYNKLMDDIRTAKKIANWVQERVS